METVATRQKIDIFTNPFLNLISEMFDQELDIEEPAVFVPEHEFMVVSKISTSAKKIAWVLSKSEHSCWDIPHMLRDSGWKKVCVWSVGSMKLAERDADRMYIDLIVGNEYGCEPPNIDVCRPFIEKIAKNFDKVFSKAEREGLFAIHAENLFSGSFKILTEPNSISIRK